MTAMGESDLTWRVMSHADTAVVTPAGRVDETTATAFGDRLVAEVAQAKAAGLRRLAIELSEVEYMSSRGLRALTIANRRGTEEGVAIVLTQPNPVMREILAISRYDKVFQVFERTEDALAA